MAKRTITATFADGSTLTRTTINPALRYAWRVTVERCYTWDKNGKKDRTTPSRFTQTGFTSTVELADKAAEGCASKRDGQHVVEKEIVEAL